METKKFGLALIEFLVHYLVYAFITVGLHEYFHLQTLRLLGGDGYIRLTWMGGYCVAEVLPKHGIWLWYLSGGLFTALVLFLLSWFMENEIEEKAAVLPFIFEQIGYGFYEMLFITRLSSSDYIRYAMILNPILHFTGFAIGLYLLLRKMIRNI